MIKDGMEKIKFTICIIGMVMLFYIIHNITYVANLEAMNKHTIFFLFSVLGVVLIIALILLLIFHVKNKRLTLMTKMLHNSNEIIIKFINAEDRLIYLKDENFKYVFVNKAVEEFYKLGSNDILGKDDYELGEDSFATLKRQTDEKVLKLYDKNIAEVNWNGRIYKTNKFPIKLLNNNIGVGSIIEDITEEKKHIREIEQTILRNTIMVDVFHREYKGLEDHMDYVLQQLLILTESLCGSIYLANDNRKEVNLIASYSKESGVALDYVEYMIKSIKETEIWEHVMFDRKSVINNEYELLCDQVSKSKDCIKLHRIIMVPIMIDSQIVSIVCLFNKNIDYNETDILQISAFMTGIWCDVERRKLSFHDHLTGLYNRR